MTDASEAYGLQGATNTVGSGLAARAQPDEEEKLRPESRAS